MPARTDHDRRDAQHAARATVAIAMGRYIRRITHEAYTEIEEVATRDHIGDVDWSAVGTAAANRALTSYGVIEAPAGAIDGSAVALEPGGDPEDDEADA